MDASPFRFVDRDHRLTEGLDDLFFIVGDRSTEVSRAA